MTLFKTKFEAINHAAKHGGTVEWVRGLIAVGVPGISHATADAYPWAVMF